MEILFIILAFIIGLFLFYKLFVQLSPEDKEYWAKQEERLKDDRIYDPVTNQFISWEELQKDEIVDEWVPSDAKVPEDALEMLDGAQLQYSIIKNRLYDLGHKLSSNDDPNLDLFYRSAIYESYKSALNAAFFEISPNATIYVKDFAYQMGNSFTGEPCLITIIKTKHHFGHHLAVPASLSNFLLKKVENSNAQFKVKGWTIKTFTECENPEVCEDTLRLCNSHNLDEDDLIDNSHDLRLTVEMLDEYLIIKCNDAVHEEQLDGFLTFCEEFS